MDEFKKLFLLLKEYLEAQKDNMALAAAESMTVMLSAVALGFILILLASVLLLLLSFALAHVVAEYSNSAALGFASQAVLVAIIGMVVWLRRNAWITQPIARLMVQIFIERRKADKEDKK
ncbi:MAG: hypothetical protein IKM92_04595 [Bacteroidaceae bacterium]|nr:hypothetical protein [Bacteroidaceae bacterium]